MSSVRRVVTGLDAQGKSDVVIDGHPERTFSWTDDPASQPNIAWIWSSESTPELPLPAVDPTLEIDQFIPARAGVRFTVHTYEPGYGVSELVIDEDALARKGFHFPPADRRTGGLDFHATASVDFGVVISGEIWLLLENSREVCLRAGDTLVQTGVIHAWQNRAQTPCTIAFVFVGT